MMHAIPLIGHYNYVEVEDAPSAMFMEVSLTSPKKYRNYDYRQIYQDNLSH